MLPYKVSRDPEITWSACPLRGSQMGFVMYFASICLPKECGWSCHIDRGPNHVEHALPKLVSQRKQKLNSNGGTNHCRTMLLSTILLDWSFPAEMSDGKRTDQESCLIGSTLRSSTIFLKIRHVSFSQADYISHTLAVEHLAWVTVTSECESGKERKNFNLRETNEKGGWVDPVWQRNGLQRIEREADH